MQTLSIIGTVWAIAASASGATPREQPTVRVCVSTDVLENGYTRIPVAEIKASRIVASINVRLQWRDNNRCRRDDAGTIRLSVRQQAVPDSPSGWLAYALPYDRSHIVVFYDRVVSSRGIVSAEDMLAYVFVHEIAHILQGISRHSASGIMKASWDNADRNQMTKGSLTFAPIDVKLICDGLKLRVADCRGWIKGHPSEE